MRSNLVFAEKLCKQVIVQYFDKFSIIVYTNISKDYYRRSCFVKFFIIVNGEYSVVRGCGWVKNFGTLRDRSCFVRTGTNQVSFKTFKHIKLFEK